MDRYQLVKLVQWAEVTPGKRLVGRKRMQKVVYLLQCAGCPIDAEYSLHYYGPYAAEVAQLADELVQVGLLIEEVNPNQVGKQFSYRVRPDVDLQSFEKTPDGAVALDQVMRFEALAKDLLSRDLNELEYAATIAYFQHKGEDWPVAFKSACNFKRLVPEQAIAKSSLELAKRVLP